MDAITIELLGSHDSGLCECCGNVSRTVWGAASHNEHRIAVYYVYWTLTRPDHGANFDLIVGKWGEGTSAQDRQAIALQFRVEDGVPQLMVTDAEHRPAGQSDLVSKALRREEVIGTSTAEEAFALVDAILAHDHRIAELLTG